jgi:hypothetical protein
MAGRKNHGQDFLITKITAMRETALLTDKRNAFRLIVYHFNKPKLDWGRKIDRRSQNLVCDICRTGEL